MGGFRAVAEIAVGVLFVAGAGFNAAYTLRHSDEFYRDVARQAWLPQARRLIATLILPHGRLLTIGIIAYQSVVAVGILSRGEFVTPALVAGGAFALGAALFSNPVGAVANVILALLQFGLAFAG